MINETFQWMPFLIFAIVSCITPGPNVIMLASSGGAFGTRKTMPHLLGICFGLPVMLLIVMFGAEEVFKNHPWAFSLLTAVSLAYVTWLSWRIFRMGFAKKLVLSARVRPMNFVEAVLYQWVNGKAWQFVLTIATLFSVGTAFARLNQAGVILVITFISGMLWIELGKRIARFLEKPMTQKIYYTTLAIALMLSTWPSGVTALSKAF